MTARPPRRYAFQGVLQILRFNWPYYAGSVTLLFLASVALELYTWPWALGFLGWMACASVTWWMIASLAASHWVYDRSPLMKWGWVSALLPESPRRWVNLHSGLDESTLELRAQFPDAKGVTFDLFDCGEMHEASIIRARQRSSRVRDTPADYAALPLQDASMDGVFLFFAAHELRTPRSREKLFGEATRILAPGGRLILAEHARDIANFAAFGPGFWHFLPRSEWRRLAAGAGLVIDQEMTITPLVHIWSLEKTSGQ